MADVISLIDGFIWGVPLMVLLVGIGLFLALRMRFVQLRGFRHAVHVARDIRFRG